VIGRLELWPEPYVRAVARLQEATTAPSTLEYSVRDAARRRLVEFHGVPEETIGPVAAAAQTIVERAAAEPEPDPRRIRLAREYAERFAFDHRTIDDAFMAELQTAFTDAEIVELSHFVWWFEGGYKTAKAFAPTA
jgi:hypothetical protein